MKEMHARMTGYVRLIVRSAFREDGNAVVPGKVVPHHGEHLVVVDVREELWINRIINTHDHIVVLVGLDRSGLALHVVNQNILIADDFLHNVISIVQLGFNGTRHAYHNVSSNDRFSRELGSLSLGLKRNAKPNDNVTLLHRRLSGEDLLHILVTFHGNNGGHKLHEETHHFVFAEA